MSTEKSSYFLTKESKFFLRQRVTEFSDIERMRNYKQSLIDSLAHPIDRGDSKRKMSIHTYQTMIVDEAKKIDNWLKKATPEFINNNLRSFEH